MFPIILSPFDVSKWAAGIPSILGNDSELKQMKEQLELEKQQRELVVQQVAQQYEEKIAGLESQVNKVRDDMDPKTGRTPFFYAVANKNRKSVVVLIDSGVNVNTPDINGISPLMIACLNRDLDIVRAICGAGGNVRVTDKNGWTALHYAAYSGANEVCSLLLSNGADVLATDNKGKIAADVARARLHSMTLGVLQRANPNTLTNAVNRSMSFTRASSIGNSDLANAAAGGSNADSGISARPPFLSADVTTPSKSPLAWFRSASKQPPPPPTLQ